MSVTVNDAEVIRYEREGSSPEKTILVYAPDGECFVAVAEPPLAAPSPGSGADPASGGLDFEHLQQEILLLQAARNAIFAYGSAQQERANHAFQIMRNASPVSGAKGRTIFLMCADAAFWVFQYIVVSVLVRSASPTDGSQLAATLTSVICLLLGLQAVWHSRPIMLSVYAIAAASSVIILIRYATQLWLFLGLRAAVLLSVVHLRLALSRDNTLERAFRSMQRHQQRRVNNLMLQIDLVVAQAQGIVHAAQQTTSARRAAATAAAEALGTDDAVPMADTGGDVATAEAAATALAVSSRSHSEEEDDALLMQTLHMSVIELRDSLASLRPLFEGAFGAPGAGDALLLGAAVSGGGSGRTAPSLLVPARNAAAAGLNGIILSAAVRQAGAFAAGGRRRGVGGFTLDSPSPREFVPPPFTYSTHGAQPSALGAPTAAGVVNPGSSDGAAGAAGRYAGSATAAAGGGAAVAAGGPGPLPPFAATEPSTTAAENYGSVALLAASSTFNPGTLRGGSSLSGSPSLPPRSGGLPPTGSPLVCLPHQQLSRLNGPGGDDGAPGAPLAGSSPGRASPSPYRHQASQNRAILRAEGPPGNEDEHVVIVYSPLTSAIGSSAATGTSSSAASNGATGDPDRYAINPAMPGQLLPRDSFFAAHPGFT